MFATVAAPSSTTSSSTSSTAVPTLTSSSVSATPTIALASSSSSHSHTGAIVGGVVGGVGGFLVLAALGFFLLRYFSKRKGGPESGMYQLWQTRVAHSLCGGAFTLIRFFQTSDRSRRGAEEAIWSYPPPHPPTHRVWQRTQKSIHNLPHRVLPTLGRLPEPLGMSPRNRTPPDPPHTQMSAFTRLLRPGLQTMLLEHALLFASAPVVSCVCTVNYPVLGLATGSDVLFVCSHIVNCWCEHLIT